MFRPALLCHVHFSSSAASASVGWRPLELTNEVINLHTRGRCVEVHTHLGTAPPASAVANATSTTQSTSLCTQVPKWPNVTKNRAFCIHGQPTHSRRVQHHSLSSGDSVQQSRTSLPLSLLRLEVSWRTHARCGIDEITVCPLEHALLALARLGGNVTNLLDLCPIGGAGLQMHNIISMGGGPA
jgi:hypothetical protein